MRKFNTRKILLIVGAVLFTVLFVFSGIMALRQYRDTRQSAEAFNAVADLVKPVPTTQPTDESSKEDAQPSAEPEPTLTSYDKYVDVYNANTDFIGWLSIEGTNIN